MADRGTAQRSVFNQSSSQLRFLRARLNAGSNDLVLYTGIRSMVLAEYPAFIILYEKQRS